MEGKNDSGNENNQTNWTFEMLLGKYEIKETPEHILKADVGTEISQDVSGIYGHPIKFKSVQVNEIQKCVQGRLEILSRGEFDVMVPRENIRTSVNDPRRHQSPMVKGGSFTIVQDAADHVLAFLDPQK